MPIKIPNGLPAAQTLAGENIFVMDETRAVTQDIRPLQILLLNKIHCSSVFFFCPKTQSAYRQVR